MDFYTKNWNPLDSEPELRDFPIFNKREWDDLILIQNADSIIRYIVFRYNPASPVYLKRSNQSRDNEARERAKLKDEVFKLFTGGDRFILSMIIAYLQHIRDSHWTVYVTTLFSFNNILKTAMEYQHIQLTGKDTITAAKELAAMNETLALMGDKLRALEGALFQYDRGEHNAVAEKLQKYAPKVIDGLVVDLVKFPVEYFASKTRDTFLNRGKKA